MNNDTPDFSLAGLTELLDTSDPDSIEALFSKAQRVCASFCTQRVLLRGIIEFSSYCRNSCAYCGLRRQNTGLSRYRLDKAEILTAVQAIAALGIGTVVLQSGEDPELDPLWLASVIEEIKQNHDIAITLSVGEWPRSSYAAWRSAGADRFLLKIETSDPQLYQRLHPGMSFTRRLRCLDDLRELEYQSGSGIIVGLPGQDKASLARDLLWLQERDFDMISIGPFIPHPETPLATVPRGCLETNYRAIALARCLTRNAHIPATSALAARAPDQRHKGLLAGANVIMPNCTPPASAPYYDIYPHSGRTKLHGSQALEQAVQQIEQAGKVPAYRERGDSLKHTQELLHEQNN